MSLLLDDPGSVAVVKRRPDVDGHPGVAGELDRAKHQHARAAGREVEHLLVGDRPQLRRRRHDPGIGRVDAVDVGVDLADVRPQRGGERDRGRVGAAATERRHVAAGRDALEAGDDRDLPLGERGAAPARPGSRRCAPAPCAPSVTIPAWSPVNDSAASPELVERDREQGDRDPLARGEEHVELARVRRAGELSGSSSSSSVVAPIAETTTHTSSPELGRRSDPPRDVRDPFGVSDRCPAELLDDETHGYTLSFEADDGDPHPPRSPSRSRRQPVGGRRRRRRCAKLSTGSSPSIRRSRAACSTARGVPSFLNVFVDGDDVRLLAGLDTQVEATDDPSASRRRGGGSGRHRLCAPPRSAPSSWSSPARNWPSRTHPSHRLGPKTKTGAG